MRKKRNNSLWELSTIPKRTHEKWKRIASNKSWISRHVYYDKLIWKIASVNWKYFIGEVSDLKVSCKTSKKEIKYWVVQRVDLLLLLHLTSRPYRLSFTFRTHIAMAVSVFYFNKLSLWKLFFSGLSWNAASLHHCIQFVFFLKYNEKRITKFSTDWPRVHLSSDKFEKLWLLILSIFFNVFYNNN